MGKTSFSTLAFFFRSEINQSDTEIRSEKNTIDIPEVYFHIPGCFPSGSDEGMGKLIDFMGFCFSAGFVMELIIASLPVRGLRGVP